MLRSTLFRSPVSSTGAAAQITPRAGLRGMPRCAPACLLAGCLLLSPGISGAFEQRLDLLGDPVAAAIGRPVRIGPDTRHVTVEGGETVRFDCNGRQFSWSFSGPLSVTSFNLRRVAPPGMLDHDVLVYIRPNPNYFGPD